MSGRTDEITGRIKEGVVVLPSGARAENAAVVGIYGSHIAVEASVRELQRSP